MIHDIDAFDAALRTDFASFLQRTFRELEPGGELSPGWHLGAIAWKLDQVRQGKVKRLLITMPPRSLKSMTVSVAFPAYLLGHAPTCRVITASYGEDLSGKHARDCRTVMQSPWYRRVFSGTRIARNRAAEHDFQTTRHGGRLSTTVGGAMTGRGGDILIIDDPIKAGDALSDTRRKAVNDWFSNTALTRLNDKRTGAVIVVMQRLHDDDLAAHLLAQGGWDHLDLPAIEWLESELAACRSALVLISHDRRFLETLTRKTLWLDRGRTRLLEKGFGAFEAWRDEVFEQEQEELHKLDRKIVREEDWLRYGVTARRKRNVRRLADLQDLKRQRATHRGPQGQVKLEASQAQDSGKLVAEARHVSIGCAPSARCTASSWMRRPHCRGSEPRGQAVPF